MQNDNKKPKTIGGKLKKFIKKYYLVTWPDNQDYIDYDGYENNAIECDDGSTFIEEKWMDAVDVGYVPKTTKFKEFKKES